jgi:hypothetical protein
MALWDNGMKMGTGLALGLGAMVLGPMVIGVAAGLARPLVKAGIKGGLFFYEKTKVAATEARETLEDLTAEARAELAEGKKKAAESGAGQGE